MLFHDDPVKKILSTAIKLRADVKRAIVAVAVGGYDPKALGAEQLTDPDIGSILQEVETGQQSEWKDIADCSPIYKSY
jgi:hypothetical protein